MAKQLFDFHEITTQGLKDFQACELYFNLEHRDREYIEPEILTEESLYADKYERVLRQIAFFYFHKKQGGLVPSYDSLIRRWERLWFPKDMDAYEMSTNQQKVKRVNLKDYSNMAIAAIESFYDEFDDDLSVPMTIDETTYVPVSREIRLVANTDLVLYSEGQFKVIHFIATRRNTSLSKYQIDLAMNRLAFEHHHTIDQGLNATYHIYNLGLSTTGFHNVKQPSDDHMRACLYWASEITKKEQFVPRRGFSAYCRGCKFDTQCLNYKWEEVEDAE